MKRIFSALFLALVLLSPVSVFAGNIFTESQGKLKTTSIDSGLGDPAQLQSGVSQAIGDFINRAVGFLGVIAVILIIYAGGLWLTAAGSDEKIKKAKMIIRSTIVGMMIVGFAYAITAFVISQLVPSEGPDAAEKSAEQVINNAEDAASSVGDQ